MCQFCAPAGQPERMRKRFMHQQLRIFVVRYAYMKSYASGRLRFRKSIVMHQSPAMPTIA